MSRAIASIETATIAQQITEALAGGLIKAAQIYKQFVDDGGDAMALRDASPLPAQVWANLEDVATGRVNPKLFLLPANTARAVKRLPITAQTEILDNGVELLAKDESQILVKTKELTPGQAKQVFGQNGVRTISEQAAYIKANIRQPVVIKASTVWEIRKGKLVVLRPTELTMAELHNILAQMG